MTNIYIASSPKRQRERNNALRISKQKENKTLCTNILSVCNTFKLIYVPFAAMLIYVLYNYFAQGNGMDFDNDGDFDAEDLWLALDTDGDGTIEVDEAAGAIAVVGGGSIGILMMIQTVVITILLYFAYLKVKAAREKDTKEIIKRIYQKAKDNNCEVLIPEDCVVGTSFTGNGKNKDIKDIQDNEIILDIGLETIKNIKRKIDQSNTVLWNGPAGYFENENFMTGTTSIAEAISKNTVKKSLISILGGGDTLAAINKSKNKLSFTHLSTAGGAFLEYLEGKDLPGLSVLK